MAVDGVKPNQIAAVSIDVKLKSVKISFFVFSYLISTISLTILRNHNQLLLSGNRKLFSQTGITDCKSRAVLVKYEAEDCQVSDFQLSCPTTLEILQCF